MERIKINNIFETIYANNTCWLSYDVNGRTGYDIIDEKHIGDESRIQFLCNKYKKLNEKYAKKNIITVCSSYLQSIIEACLQSDNEIYFVEYEDIQDNLLLSQLKDEVVNLNIHDVGTFDEDGCAITVAGEVLTRFLF